MDPIDINYQLRKHKSSQAEIARKLNVTRSAVNQVVYGTRRTRRIMNAIAKAVGMKVEKLWPDAA